MGNCCGGTDYPTGDYTEGGNSTGQKPGHTTSGAPPPRNIMTPDEEARREQLRQAAEERARKNAVRGTQRYTPKRKAAPIEKIDKGGPDISDWS